ncbi:MAG: serine/threonine-protein kinase [Polyangiaceae bacterium]
MTSKGPERTQDAMISRASSRVLRSFPGFQTLELLGTGPIADRYKALQQPLGRTVLIKALSPSILPSSPFAASLEHEARLLAQLEHPNLLKLYDFERSTDSMWLVLEYVEGVSLRELLGAGEEARRLEPLEAVSVAVEITRALEHAHEHGIVHRNLRPDNILLTPSGGLKLLEFAAASDDRIPTAPELMDGEVAAPAYFSPEQILGEPPDPRSDLFALGVMLYEMLGGRRPFDGPDLRSTTQRIRHDVPPALSRLAPHVPSQLDRLVQRLLEKMPADRFGSAAELHLALLSVLEDDGRTPAELIRHALGRNGLAAIDDLGEEELALPEEAPRSLSSALLGMLAVCALILLGGVVIQIISARDGSAPSVSQGSHALELRPSQAGYLRVVADPWAYVIVDGEKVETTPFAEPIPLSPGTHYVRLEHPAAPTERRTITLAPGESILLDVKLDVPRRPEPILPSHDAGTDAPVESP